MLVTDNDTNVTRLFGAPARGRLFKDGINDAVVNGRTDALSTTRTGTKAAAHYVCEVAAGGSVTFQLRLTDRDAAGFVDGPFGAEFDRLFDARRREAETQRIGDQFLSAVEAAILFVPSVIVLIRDSPDWNIVINHRHTAAGAITIERIEPFQLDVRLL